MQGGVLFRNWATIILRAGALATVLSFLVLGFAALAVDQAFVAPINASSHVFFGPEAAHAGGFDFLYTGVGGAIHIVACFFWAIVALFLAMMLGARRRLLIWLCGISTALIAAVFDYGLLPANLSPGWELVLDGQGVAMGFLALGIGWSVGLVSSMRAARATQSTETLLQDSLPEHNASQKGERR